MSSNDVHVETRATGSYDLRDVLTGARGRYVLLNEVDQLMGKKIFVCLVDVDNFRLFNDAYGENVGDELLRQIGEVLQGIFGDEHTFRYGSDEFVVVDDFESEEALLVPLRQVREQVVDIAYSGIKLGITCSVGYAYGTIEESDDLHEAIRFADRKMYEAKRQGKDRVVGGALKSDPFMDDSRHHARIYKSYEEDELTGLANSVHFRNVLSKLLKTAPRGSENPLTVVFFNVQNFKAYNERYGFTAGDELLVTIGRSIEETFPNCLSARSGSDQFMVVAARDDVVSGIKAVRDAFRRRLKDSSIRLTAGFYTPGDERVSSGVICDRAKQACDSIKGRRDIYYREYDEELKRQIATRQYVLDHFEEALEEGYIRVFYQPIVRVSTREVCDEEALARWVDPARGPIFPNEFIPVLEEARLIHRLDLHMVKLVCQDIQHRKANGIKEELPTISINLSRLDFELCDIVSEIEKILEEFDLPRSFITIEVTESALTGNQEFLKGEIDRFRADGFEVWMDDFGSGYSSLNLLKEYTFDLVKLDMGFMSGFTSNEGARVLVANIINLAKELNLKTLAEGVETEEQLQFLQSVGCGRAQGFLFGKPESLDKVEREIEEGEYLPIEHISERGFYGKIARINLQHPIPAGDIEGHYVPSDVPAAIVLRRKGIYRYLNATDMWRQAVKSIGAETLDESERRINDPTRVQHSRFNECFDMCQASGDWAWTTYFEGGKYMTLSMRIIATDERTDSIAALVIFSSVQEAKNVASLGNMGVLHF